jgi:glycosyltransferase involved in cell wall biosynthesis
MITKRNVGKEMSTKNDGKTPLVSVISVVRNGVSTFEDTILSVKENYSDELEYIIIDGGSDDGTLNLIRKHETIVDYWISEPDRGIYDALNKGIAASRGHFFIVLNVGDKLITLPYRELDQARRLGGDVVLFDVLLSNQKIIKSKIDYRTRFGNTIHHQGAFYRRGLNIVFDLSYKVYSDFDVNQKLFLQGKKFIKFDKLVSYHSLDGISNERKYRGEYFSVIRKNFGIFWVIIGALYIWQGEMRIKFKNFVGIRQSR